MSSRAALLLRALSQACRLMANVDYKDWVNHWGRGVTHHSGFIPMLLRLQVIRKSAARDRGSLCLGLGSSSYRLASRAQSTRLGAWVAASDVIAQVLEANSTPRTLEESGTSGRHSKPAARSCQLCRRSYRILCHASS